MKWCIANESNIGSAYEGPWLRYTRLRILLSQCFPVLVRMAYFHCKGFTHLLTLVFFLTLRETCYLSVSLTLGIVRNSTRLVRRLPLGSIRTVVQWTSESRWLLAVCSLWDGNLRDKMTNGVFVWMTVTYCSWWQKWTSSRVAEELMNIVCKIKGEVNCHDSITQETNISTK